MEVKALSRDCEQFLTRNGLRIIARVRDTSRATDLAVMLAGRTLAVVRCVNRAKLKDYDALVTMVAEGDFVWAGLVYGDSKGPDSNGPIVSFHESELARLAADLRQLQETAP